VFFSSSAGCWRWTPVPERVMTGGVVAHNLHLVQMMEEHIGRSILVRKNPS